MYERFSDLLTSQGLKPADITKATGIRSTVFSEWKKGKSAPNAEKLVKIAHCLNTTVEYLVTGETSQPAQARPISDFEYNLILAYRKADSIDQTSIRRTLNLDDISLKKGELA